MSDILREETDGESDDVAERIVEAEPVSSPSGAPEATPAHDAAAEEEVAVPTDSADFSDLLLKEWSQDPVKKGVLDKMIAKEAKRQKDADAGKWSWIEKDRRKGYEENPEKWKEDLRKIEDYDRLKTDSEKMRAQAESSSAVSSTKAEKPVDDVTDIAKAFVAAQNIAEDQIPVIAELLKLVDNRLDGRVAKKVEATVPQAIDMRNWTQDRDWATSQSDYKSNRTLRALAHDYAAEGMGPKEALLQARKDLGIVPPKTTISQGKPAVGKPAFSRSSESGAGEEDADDYDGTDPLQKLKAKLAKR